MGVWECGRCKTKQPSTATVCLTCAVNGHVEKAPPLPPMRSSQPSFGHIMDTKSFVLPVGKQIIWIWVGVAVGLPAVMSLAYFLLNWFTK